MRRLTFLLLIVSIMSLSPYCKLLARAQTNGVGVNQQYVTGFGAGTHAYLIATLPTSTAGTYDHLHLVASFNSNDGATSVSTIDAIFGNRGGLAYLYSAKGASPTGNHAHLAAYQQSDGSVNLYFMLADYWDAGSYTILEAQQETIYTSPTDLPNATPPGTLIFDTASPSYLPSNFTSFTGSFGIGTTNPYSTLFVSTLPGLNSPTTYTNGPNGQDGVFINATQDNNPYLATGDIGVAAGYSNVNAGGSQLRFLTQARSNGAVPTPRMIIDKDGNVGIGTGTPSARFEINGNVQLTSGSGASITFPDSTVQSTAWNGTTLGGDYAESIDVLGDRTAYEPGDVICINVNAPGKFNKSSAPYSKLVSGVYSTKPGLVGRRTTAERPDKAAEVPMAMMGIVPVKVSSENGAIEPGDLLVSAGTPGYAMKGTDKDRLTGTVIGKALAPLKSGSGVIEVLLALQ